jgi:hypothetical protein
MIKLGKACSQLMEANNTDETNIKVVRKYFRLTYVFNALKTSLIFYKLINISDFILVFEIRGMLSV